MNQVFTTLPDDRPITSIVVVENPDKCPKNYNIVLKTHDQDSDADLWRENGFFARKMTRYLCLSKTEGPPDRFIDEIVILSEKETPPEGYSCPSLTWDTNQKAWRKKRLYYKFGHACSSQSAVTDIIVLSRSKKPPEEFVSSGEINGMLLCHKLEKVSQPALVIPYNLRPSLPVRPGPDYMNTPISPVIQDKAVRRAPPPPPKSSTATYATISGFGGLEGVPFVLNPSFSFSDNSISKPVSSLLVPRTSDQINEEFSYSFRAERATYLSP